MRSPIVVVLMSLGLSLAIPGASSGQSRKADSLVRLVIGLDANGDRVIEPDEIPESEREAVARLLKLGDENKNGKLETEEIRNLMRKLREKDEGAGPAGNLAAAAAIGDRIRAMDANNDGKVSKDEFQGPAAIFDRLDTNKDGAITRDEMSGPIRNRAALARGKAAIPNELGAFLKRMDTDNDGKISKAEFPRAELFHRLDTDNDGFLQPRELNKAAGKLPSRLRIREKGKAGFEPKPPQAETKTDRPESDKP